MKILKKISWSYKLLLLSVAVYLFYSCGREAAQEFNNYLGNDESYLSSHQSHKDIGVENSTTELLSDDCESCKGIETRKATIIANISKATDLSQEQELILSKGVEIMNATEIFYQETKEYLQQKKQGIEEYLLVLLSKPEIKTEQIFSLLQEYNLKIEEHRMKRMAQTDGLLEAKILNQIDLFNSLTEKQKQQIKKWFKNKDEEQEGVTVYQGLLSYDILDLIEMDITFSQEQKTYFNEIRLQRERKNDKEFLFMKLFPLAKNGKISPLEKDEIILEIKQSEKKNEARKQEDNKQKEKQELEVFFTFFKSLNDQQKKQVIEMFQY